MKKKPISAGSARPIRDRVKAPPTAPDAVRTELARAHALNRDTLEATTDGILVVDGQRQVAAFNQRFVEMWGIPEEVVASGDRAKFLAHAEGVLKDPDAFVARTAVIYKGGDAETLDVWTLKDGRVFERLSKLSTLADNPGGRVWSYRDITARRRAEEAMKASHDRFAAIIDQSPVGIFLLDSDLRFQHVNATAQPFLGEIENPIGRTLSDVASTLWPPEVATTLSDLFRRTLETGVPHFDKHFAAVRKDLGEQQYYEWELHRITLPDGQKGLVCYFIEISTHVHAQEALRRREEEMLALADSIPQLAWMAAPEGHIFWYNRRWYDYTGTTFEQMEGWGWQSVHDPKILPQVIERWKASIETGAPFDMEFPLRRADGVFRWFLTRVNPLRDNEGKVVRWFGTNTDIDQAKRAEDAVRGEASILELINKTGSAIAAELDLQTIVQSVTDTGTKLTDAKFGAFFYNITDENGDALLLYALSGAPREAFEKFGHPRATALFGPTFRGEGPIRSDDILQDPRYGTMAPHHGMPKGHLPVRSYLAVPVTLRSGEVVGGLFFGHPEPSIFTERSERLIVAVAAQAAIAIDNARLFEAAQRELRQRKEAEADRERLLVSEKEARAQAERETAMKDEFLATVSHELRTPLNAILGWANLLRTGSSDTVDITEGLEVIERNARSQAQIIEDLLDMSRIVSGNIRLDVQQVDVVQVINASLDSVRPTAAAREIRLTSVLDPQAGPISGDPARIQQILWNLLTNALKFTPKGGRVHVVLERVESHLEIAVSDSGRGIAPEFLPHVFDRFRQADASTTREHRGLGLGLAIVKNLSELHGGSVRAHSAGRDQGAVFTVTFPLTAAHGASVKTRHHPRSGACIGPKGEPIQLDGIRVLAVDDEPDARHLIKRVLANCGAEVETAESGAATLAILAKTQPQVLIMDIGMPGEDGYTVMRKVRALPAKKGGRIPAIALTAFARSEDRRRAILSGFQMHMAKPVEPSELIAMVASLAGRTDTNL